MGGGDQIWVWKDLSDSDIVYRQEWKTDGRARIRLKWSLMDNGLQEASEEGSEARQGSAEAT